MMLLVFFVTKCVSRSERHLVAQKVAGLHARQRVEVQVQVAAADGRGRNLEDDITGVCAERAPTVVNEKRLTIRNPHSVCRNDVSVTAAFITLRVAEVKNAMQAGHHAGRPDILMAHP